LVFLAGAGIGSIFFNEFFGVLKGLYEWGDRGVRFAWQDLNLSASGFGFLMVAAALFMFWGAEFLEKRRALGGAYWRSPFLRSFSAVMILLALGLMAMDGRITGERHAADRASTSAMLSEIESAKDHMEPEELADRLMGREPGLMVVDIRSVEEYAEFHIRGAVNLSMSDLPEFLAGRENKGIIVLYSNGMTHPAQARDAMFRLGFTNVYLLTDGLVGFVDRILKPASLRTEPLSAEQTARINSWRSYFTGDVQSQSAQAEPEKPLTVSQPVPPAWPGLVEPAWLAENLGSADIRVIEVRPQPQYNSGHIPGSVCVSYDNFRGVVGGVSSMLQPAELLAGHMSLMGIRPTDRVVLVYDDKPHDATLLAMAFARLGHARFGILNGGFPRWAQEKRLVTTELPPVQKSNYAVPAPDTFTVTYKKIMENLKAPDYVVIDVRPTEYYTGEKVDEARGGHIPGAKSRPYTEDVAKFGKLTGFKSPEELAKAYASLVPTKQTTVIIHCRTGHQASQTFFVMRYLLGYERVLWYDAGWSEWAARSELPVER
jgi:thiosulfate/3-mercaptopyruvate sulfurtransferase